MIDNDECSLHRSKQRSLFPSEEKLNWPTEQSLETFVLLGASMCWIHGYQKESRQQKKSNNQEADEQQSKHWRCRRRLAVTVTAKSLLANHFSSFQINLDHFWSLLVTWNHFRSLLFALDRFMQLQITWGHFKLSQITFVRFKTIHVILDWFRSLPITPGPFKSIQVTADHFRSLLLASDRFWSLSIVSDHLPSPPSHSSVAACQRVGAAALSAPVSQSQSSRDCDLWPRAPQCLQLLFGLFACFPSLHVAFQSASSLLTSWVAQSKCRWSCDEATQLKSSHWLPSRFAARQQVVCVCLYVTCLRLASHVSACQFDASDWYCLHFFLSLWTHGVGCVCVCVYSRKLCAHRGVLCEIFCLWWLLLCRQAPTTAACR